MLNEKAQRPERAFGRHKGKWYLTMIQDERRNKPQDVTPERQGVRPMTTRKYCLEYDNSLGLLQIDTNIFEFAICLYYRIKYPYIE